jgi:hypothetical protein
LNDEWIEPSALPVLSGDEKFTGTDATVLEFWRWGFGDLRMNIVRGVLSEYLVAKALGLETTGVRDPWDNYDLRYGDTTIEVKSAASWQSYRVKGRSKLVFTGLSRRRWDEESGMRREEAEVIADLYIFAAHSCDSPTDYDPLSTNQWTFYVVPGKDVRGSGRKSVSLGSLSSRAQACSFGELKDEVDRQVAAL